MDEESRITQVAMVQKCLDDIWPEEDKKLALIYLLTAIRHYCKHEGLIFADVTRQATWMFRDERNSD